MSQAAPLLRIPVGVVVERRKAFSPWADFIWRPVAVLEGVPDAAPWTVTRMFLAFDWISVCVASTCSTSEVPMP